MFAIGYNFRGHLNLCERFSTLFHAVDRGYQGTSMAQGKMPLKMVHKKLIVAVKSRFFCLQAKYLFLVK